MGLKKLFENGTNFYIPWSNQTGKTIAVALVDEDNVVIKKQEIIPGENIVVPPKNKLRLIS